MSASPLRRWLFLVGAFGVAQNLVAQPAQLVRDINTVVAHGFSSDSAPLAPIGNGLYFSAATGILSTGLWYTDGTVEGTRLIRETSNMSGQVVRDGVLFFGDCEFWRTDGTSAGTTLVMEINPGAACSNPHKMVNASGVIYFVANAGVGLGLWKSDGTANGTQLLKPGSPTLLTNVGATLYFVMSDAATGAELWKSDGTVAGTQLVKDICPGECDSLGRNPMFATLMGDLIFFPAQEDVSGYARLWRSDGTPDGTFLVHGSSFFPKQPVAVGQTLYYGANGGLWKSDGTPTSTTLVKAVAADRLAALDDAIVFTVGNELWRSDGTEAGTVPIADPCASSCLFDNVGFVRHGAELLFMVNRHPAQELWKTDATTAGTALIRPFAPATSPARIENLTVASSSLYFSGLDDLNGWELWKLDPASVTTTQLTDGVSAGSLPRKLTAVGERVFFQSYEPATGEELWVSDGTYNGTGLTRDIHPGWSGTWLAALTPFGDRLLFGAIDETGAGLWTTAGTEIGTRKLVNRWPSLEPPQSSMPASRGRAYFAAFDSTYGAELWSTDGSSKGTRRVTDIAPGNSSSDPHHMLDVDGELFFGAAFWSKLGMRDGLWKSNGTSAGTVRIKEIHAWKLTRVGREVFFLGYSLEQGSELWKTDGTRSGTVLVKDCFPGRDSLFADQLTAVGHRLFFVALDEDHGWELWASDGTAAGTGLVKDITVGSSWSVPTELTAFGGSLFFNACDLENGCELWTSNGSSAGTYRIKDINPFGSSSPAHLSVAGDHLYFAADDGFNGVELWKTDGTESGTVLVQDIRPGPASSFPREITQAGSKMFFAADDGDTGTELWMLPLGPYLTIQSTSLTEDVCRKKVAEVTVTLSSASSAPVIVEYTTIDGTAAAGEDYLPASGTLDFAPGVTSRLIRVPIRSDRVLEPDDYFSVTLTGTTGGILDETHSTAAVWIEDKPQPLICR